MLNRQFGQLARKINQRIGQLRAAKNLAVMRTIPAARCHELSGDLKGCFAVDVSGNYRLIFAPDHIEEPLKEDGGIDWNAITIIEIQEITDYH
ncbi:MAG: type II toxin-antitoxin system RelE/ParE family toxin [Bacteroidota bacterium]